VQDVADSCRTGAATNVIFGLALGYKSVIIPIFSIAIAIYVSFSLAAMYGIAVAALGMLSTIATGLAIDAYGPISDNAGGIAEMAGMSHEIRERTDALDAAGNTTAAIGKVISFSSSPLLFFFFFFFNFFSGCSFPLLTKCCVITSTLGFSTRPASTLRSQVNLY
jgi:Na+/H+-translocating membrane pyrophosphatase